MHNGAASSGPSSASSNLNITLSTSPYTLTHRRPGTEIGYNDICFARGTAVAGATSRKKAVGPDLPASARPYHIFLIDSGLCVIFLCPRHLSTLQNNHTRMKVLFLLAVCGMMLMLATVQPAGTYAPILVLRSTVTIVNADASPVLTATPLYLPRVNGSWTLLTQPTETTRRNGLNYYTHGGRNGLLDAVHAAYLHHMRLVLNPDVIWLVIVASLDLQTIPRDIAIGNWSRCDEWPFAVMESLDDVPEALPTFSTTTNVSRTACRAFAHSSARMKISTPPQMPCANDGATGIAQVLFQGAVGDWFALPERVAKLPAAFLAAERRSRLVHALTQLAASAQAAFHRWPQRGDLMTWWSRIYHDGCCNHEKGWIHDIAPARTQSWAQVSVIYSDKRRVALFAGTWDAEFDAERGSITPQLRIAVAELGQSAVQVGL